MDTTEPARSSRIALLGAGAGMVPGILIAAAQYSRSAEIVWGILLIPIGYIGGIWLALARSGYIRAGWTTTYATFGYLGTVVGISLSGWLNGRRFPTLVGVGAALALAALSAYVAGALVPGKLVHLPEQAATASHTTRREAHPAAPRQVTLSDRMDSARIAVVGAAGGMVLVVVVGAFEYSQIASIWWTMRLVFPIGYIGGIWLALARKGYRRAGWATSGAFVGFTGATSWIGTTGLIRIRPTPVLISVGVVAGVAVLSALVSGAFVPRRPHGTPQESGQPLRQRQSATSDALAVAGNTALGLFLGTVAGFGFAVLVILTVKSYGLAALAAVFSITTTGSLIGALVGMGVAIRKRTR